MYVYTHLYKHEHIYHSFTSPSYKHTIYVSQQEAVLLTEPIDSYTKLQWHPINQDNMTILYKGSKIYLSSSILSNILHLR